MVIALPHTQVGNSVFKLRISIEPRKGVDLESFIKELDWDKEQRESFVKAALRIEVEETYRSGYIPENREVEP